MILSSVDCGWLGDKHLMKININKVINQQGKTSDLSTPALPWSCISPLAPVFLPAVAPAPRASKVGLLMAKGYG